MIKVIKHGNKPKLVKTCPDCGCEFEFELEDLKVDYTICLTSYPVQYRRYVTCPDCGRRIYHDTIAEQIGYIPNIIYTSNQPNISNSCEGCSFYERLKNGEIYVGDSPCTWCKKMQPYCTCIHDDIKLDLNKDNKVEIKSRKDEDSFF